MTLKHTHILVTLAFVASAAVAVDDAVDRHQPGTTSTAVNRITTTNVADLQLAWEFHTGEVIPAKIDDKLIAFEDHPSLIDGNLVICTTSRRLIALDPQTGKQRWVFDPQDAKVGTQKCRGISHW